MRTQITNDSLVYSQQGREEENLLSDTSEFNQSITRFEKPEIEDLTIKIDKNLMKMNQLIKNNSELALSKYLKNQSSIKKQQTTIKSFRKLDKDRSNFLGYDPKIQKVALKSSAKQDKINQLVQVIESERLLQRENRLKDFGISLLEIAQDVINEKKCIQREIQNLIDLNKLMTAKLRDCERYLQQIKNVKISECNCHKSFSFSKNKQSPINYLDRFQFAKTIISSVEQLQLKKIEQEENISITEMPIMELLLAFKNKAEGVSTKISQGLLDRVASGSTLKQWIKKIDQKLTSFPNISDFQNQAQDTQENENTMIQFLAIIKNQSDKLLQNIKNSKDPNRQLLLQKYSVIQTFIQILQDQFAQYSHQQVMAYYGDINRYLTLIEKKCGLQRGVESQNNKFWMKDLRAYIEKFF